MDHWIPEYALEAICVCDKAFWEFEEQKSKIHYLFFVWVLQEGWGEAL